MQKIKKVTKKTKKQYFYNDYAEKVLKNELVTCKWTKKACQRYFDDLENGKARGIWFDEKAARHIIDFFGYIPHVKGEWAGQPIILEPWEQFIVANIFGWKNTDGTRRFREVYLECGRKNGKSALMAGIGLYMLVAEGEAGGEVYSAATTRDQAKIVFDMAKRMVKTSDLKKIVGVYQFNLHYEKTACKFEPLASESDSLDGLGPHCCLIDELHAHKTPDLFMVLKTAIGARRQPLIISITTAGFNKQSICFEQKSYLEKILDGVIEDDTFFGISYQLDEGDDWEDESVWIKANPNLDISVKRTTIRQTAKKAKEIPSQLNDFLRKHLNIWTEASTRWISIEKYDSCKYAYTENELLGRPCYGGLDLSSTTDISAFALVFPPIFDSEPFKILIRFWIPEENMTLRSRRDRVPYDVWTKQGLITATPGNAIDYSYILHTIEEDSKHFDIKEIAFDRWGATKIMQDLTNMGWERPQDNKYTERHLIDFGQGFASMSAPTKELEKMILSREIAHDGNPVLRWMASNVVIKMDGAGNMKVDKGASMERVDGVVATIMALSRAVIHQENEGPMVTIL